MDEVDQAIARMKGQRINRKIAWGRFVRLQTDPTKPLPVTISVFYQRWDQAHKQKRVGRTTVAAYLQRGVLDNSQDRGV